MINRMRLLASWAIVAFVLAFGSPALAASGGGDHADEGAHHVSFVGDDDHDGTPNWTDGDSEAFVWIDLASHFINLVLLLGLIGYAARRPVGDALRGRALDIRRELTETARERDEAKQRADELETRLAKFEDEVASMRAEAAQDAKNEEAKLLERAREQADRIKDGAQRSIRDELQRARTELRSEAILLAVQLAESSLSKNISDKDHQKLARDFLSSLNRSPDA